MLLWDRSPRHKELLLPQHLRHALLLRLERQDLLDARPFAFRPPRPPGFNDLASWAAGRRKTILAEGCFLQNYASGKKTSEELMSAELCNG